MVVQDTNKNTIVLQRFLKTITNHNLMPDLLLPKAVILY